MNISIVNNLLWDIGILFSNKETFVVGSLWKRAAREEEVPKVASVAQKT